MVFIHIYMNLKTIDVQALAQAAKQQFESVYNQKYNNSDGTTVTVNATADITAINSKDELANNATLIDVRNEDDDVFKDKNGKTTKGILGIATSGKHIALNASNAKDFYNGENNKTIAHEIGHTGGLRHPNNDLENTVQPMIPYSQYPQNSNFMNQDRQLFNNGFDSKSNFTEATRSQIDRIYRLYENNFLNKNFGIHPVDVYNPIIKIFNPF